MEEHQSMVKLFPKIRLLNVKEEYILAEKESHPTHSEHARILIFSYGYSLEHR